MSATRWHGLPLWLRVGGFAVVLVVALNLGARLLDASLSGDDGSGVSGSSYSDGADGLSALAELLRRSGHPVERQRGNLADGDLDPAATLFVLEPNLLAPDEIAALDQFLANDGRLVVGGPEPRGYLSILAPDAAAWRPSGPTSWQTIDSRLAPVREVSSLGGAGFVSIDGGDVLVAEGSVALVVRPERAVGELIALADVSPLTNALLDANDNAALALLLAGPDGTPAMFAEGVHGFGSETGLDAVPERWKSAIVVALLAAVVLLVARGRRLGPPVLLEPPEPPTRREYVDAVATTLARSGDRVGATEPLRSSLGDVARSSSDEGAPPARALEPSDHEVVDGVTTDDDVVALGRLHWQHRGREEAP